MFSRRCVRANALAAVIALAVAPAAIAAPVATYTFEGTIAFDAMNSAGDPAILASIQGALPTGTAISLTVDIDFGTPDSDPTGNTGLYQSAVSGSNAAIGGFAFTPGSNPCIDPNLDCRVQAQKDLVPMFFDQFIITSEVMDSPAFSAAIAPPASPFFGAAVFFFLSAGGPALLSNDDIVDPTTLPFTFGRMTIAFPGMAGFEFARYVFTIDNVHEGQPSSSIDAPASFALFGLALAGIGFAARQRRPR